MLSRSMAQTKVDPQILQIPYYPEIEYPISTLEPESDEAAVFPSPCGRQCGTGKRP